MPAFAFCVLFVLFAAWALLPAQPAAQLAAPAGEASLTGEDGQENSGRPGAGAAGYSVTFTIAGDDDGTDKADLTGRLKAASVLIRDEDKPPFSPAGLAQRAQRDRELLQRVLKSEGYYQPEIEIGIGEGEPLPVTLTVAPGPQTKIGVFEIFYAGGDDLTRLNKPDLADLGIALGQAARAEAVADAEALLIEELGNNGFPDAAIAARRIGVDLDRNLMQVRLTVDPGRYRVFGPLTVAGLDRSDEDYVRRVLAWPEGETFDKRQLETLRRRAVATGLFGRVEIARDPPQDPTQDPAGAAAEAVRITLTERPPRRVSLGAGFATDFSNTPFGFIGEASWMHRNLLGRGENLRLTANAQPDEQAGSLFFDKPNWLRNDKSLQWFFTVGNEDRPAYRQFSVESTLGVERKLGRHWAGYAGGSFKYLLGDDGDAGSGRETSVLYGIPARLTYDGRDDRLDPTGGVLGVLAFTPTLVTVTNTAVYLQASLSGAAYRRLPVEPDIVLAARAKVASLAGTAAGNIPAGQRLYAGGGGSVRGYEIDSLGPLDSGKDSGGENSGGENSGGENSGGGEAIGGRSLIEFGLEARWRFWEDYGLVPFVDAGQVYGQSYPDFNGDLQFAGGLGFRYYSPIGPIRLDLAAPIGKRQRDRAFQFYISIGQSF
ncbi:MAG: BamA/TamA family outer membrane protein [Rhodospirillales bacterium]|nr:BamA/TamA family outer membrane protein [Rhodospirillales bacterium]